MLSFHRPKRIAEQLTHSLCLMSIRLRLSRSFAKQIFSLCKCKLTSALERVYTSVLKFALGRRSLWTDSLAKRPVKDQRRLLGKTLRREARSVQTDIGLLIFACQVTFPHAKTIYLCSWRIYTCTPSRNHFAINAIPLKSGWAVKNDGRHHAHRAWWTLLVSRK